MITDRIGRHKINYKKIINFEKRRVAKLWKKRKIYIERLKKEKNSPIWRKPQFRNLDTVSMVIETKVVIGFFKLKLLNVIGLLNCLLTNFLITTWQVNKWKIGVFFLTNHNLLFILQIFMITTVIRLLKWCELFLTQNPRKAILKTLPYDCIEKHEQHRD